jgi:hypothetical protein
MVVAIDVNKGQWHQVVPDLSTDRLCIILDGTIVLDDDTTLVPELISCSMAQSFSNEV